MGSNLYLCMFFVGIWKVLLPKGLNSATIYGRIYEDQGSAESNRRRTKVTYIFLIHTNNSHDKAALWRCSVSEDITTIMPFMALPLSISSRLSYFQ